MRDVCAGPLVEDGIRGDELVADELGDAHLGRPLVAEGAEGKGHRLEGFIDGVQDGFGSVHLEAVVDVNVALVDGGAVLTFAALALRTKKGRLLCEEG